MHASDALVISNRAFARGLVLWCLTLLFAFASTNAARAHSRGCPQVPNDPYAPAAVDPNAVDPNADDSSISDRGDARVGADSKPGQRKDQKRRHWRRGSDRATGASRPDRKRDCRRRWQSLSDKERARYRALHDLLARLPEDKRQELRARLANRSPEQLREMRQRFDHYRGNSQEQRRRQRRAHRWLHFLPRETRQAMRMLSREQRVESLKTQLKAWSREYVATLTPAERKRFASASRDERSQQLLAFLREKYPQPQRREHWTPRSGNGPMNALRRQVARLPRSVRQLLAQQVDVDFESHASALEPLGFDAAKWAAFREAFGKLPPELRQRWLRERANSGRRGRPGRRGRTNPRADSRPLDGSGARRPHGRADSDQ